ncbi:MAG: hypothetical protein AAGF84_15220 [Planctomycetota bacterium]
MDISLGFWCCLVTGLCLLGLWHRPRTLYEALAPRFVVPAIIWLATVANVIIRTEVSLPTVTRAFELHAVAAMQYVALCLLVFWAGYALPVGSAIGGRAPYMPVDLRKHSTVFLAGCIALLIVQGIGGLLIQFIPPIRGLMSVFLRVAPFGSAVLLGLYLGSKPRIGFFHLLLSAVILLVAMYPLMGRFSRGVGLPVLIALMAFSYMRRTVYIVPTLLAGFVLVYCGVQGLAGRSVHGHYGGAAAYLEFLITSPPSASQLLSGTRLIHDSVSPTCVAMLAREEPASHTGTMSVADWLLNCIPVPRAFGLPDYTMSLGSFIAGRRIGWGYTSGMFGDTVHHLGWWGALFFLGVGAFYRAVEGASFRKFGGPYFTTEWYSFLCILSYYALTLGMYNTVRTWLTLCVFGVYALIGLMFFKALFGTQSRPPGPTAYRAVVGQGSY